MTARSLTTLPLLLLLTACASTSGPPARIEGDVGYDAVALDDDNRLQIEPGRFTNADPPVGERRVLPVYPPQRLAERLSPLTLCAELWIDADGMVQQVHPITHPPECPEPADSRREGFDLAIESAVRQWPFLPAFVCEDDAAGGQDFDCHGNGRVRYIPIRLTYRFTFRQSEAGGSVTIQSASP